MIGEIETIEENRAILREFGYRGSATVECADDQRRWRRMVEIADKLEGSAPLGGVVAELLTEFPAAPVPLAGLDDPRLPDEARAAYAVRRFLCALRRRTIDQVR